MKPLARLSFLLLFFVPLAFAQDPPPPSPESSPEIYEESEASRPGHRAVRSLRLLLPDAGRVAWSTQGDRLAFDRPGPDGHRQIWTVAPDGKDERCLSCDIHEFRKANVLDPAWHPSGELLIVQVQELRRRPDLGVLELAGPGRAVASDLWTLPTEGRQVFRLTPETGNRTGPFVSYEAGRILWSERLWAGDRKVYGPWGQWGVRVAELKVRRGIPRVGRVRTHEIEAPGPILAQGFTPDDRGLLLERDGRLLRLPLPGDKGSGGERTLVGAADARYGPARFGPASGRLAWASTRGLEATPPGGSLPFRSDLWLAVEQPDGTFREERLTFFNDPASEHFLGAAAIADLDWSPGGDRIALQVISTDRGVVREALWILALDNAAL